MCKNRYGKLTLIRLREVYLLPSAKKTHAQAKFSPAGPHRHHEFSSTSLISSQYDITPRRTCCFFLSRCRSDGQIYITATAKVRQLQRSVASKAVRPTHVVFPLPMPPHSLPAVAFLPRRSFVRCLFAASEAKAGGASLAPSLASRARFPNRRTDGHTFTYDVRSLGN